MYTSVCMCVHGVLCICQCSFVCVCIFCVYQEEKDQQWKQAMDYLSAVTELNYMTQIVIMLYEDNNKVLSLHHPSLYSSHCLIHLHPRGFSVISRLLMCVSLVSLCVRVFVHMHACVCVYIW